MTYKKQKRKFLSYANRQTIEKMLKNEIGVAAIAEFLGFNRATIYKELLRCERGKYTAEEAQRSTIGH